MLLSEKRLRSMIKNTIAEEFNLKKRRNVTSLNEQSKVVQFQRIIGMEGELGKWDEDTDKAWLDWLVNKRSTLKGQTEEFGIDDLTKIGTNWQENSKDVNLPPTLDGIIKFAKLLDAGEVDQLAVEKVQKSDAALKWWQNLQGKIGKVVGAPDNTGAWTIGKIDPNRESGWANPKGFTFSQWQVLGIPANADGIERSRPGGVLDYDVVDVANGLDGLPKDIASSSRFKKGKAIGDTVMSDYNLYAYSGKATADEGSDPQVDKYDLVLAFDGPGGKNYKVVGMVKHKFAGTELYMPLFMKKYLNGKTAELSLVDTPAFLKRYGFDDSDIENMLTNTPNRSAKETVAQS